MIKAKRLGQVDEWGRPLAMDDNDNLYCDINCGDGLHEKWLDITYLGEPNHLVQLSFENNPEVKGV